MNVPRQPGETTEQPAAPPPGPVSPQRFNEPEAPEPDLPDDWEAMFSGEGQPQDTPEQQQPPADRPESIAEDDDEEAGEDDLRRELQQLRQIVYGHAARGAQPTTDNQTPPEDPVEQLLDGMGLNEETSRFMKSFGDAVRQATRQEMQSQLGGRLQQLEQKVGSQEGNQLLAAFDSSLDQMMTEAGLDDVEKQMFSPAVKFYGLQQYGRGFGLPQAKKVFRQLHNQYVRRQQQSEDEEVEAEAHNTNAPPPTRRGSNQHGAADVEKTILNSQHRSADFGGSTFRRMVRSKLAAAARQAGLS